jgi:hypothetical protein
MKSKPGVACNAPTPSRVLHPVGGPVRVRGKRREIEIDPSRRSMHHVFTPDRRWLLLAGATSIALTVAFGATAMGGPPADGPPAFEKSEIQRKHEDMILADLDGDRRRDLVLLGEDELAIFFQDGRGRFPREPDIVRRIESPTLVWASPLRRAAESLLLLTRSGVAELAFEGRTGAPKASAIIEDTSVLPDRAEGPAALAMRLSAATGGPYPLILVPAGEDLHVWRRDGGWRRVQTLRGIGQVSVAGPRGGMGHEALAAFDLDIADADGDGREDLMTCRRSRGRALWLLRRQMPDGIFSEEPRVLLEDEDEPNLWHGWIDLDRDGALDLVKGRWLDEPWFLPTIRSGKVLVEVFRAGTGGEIPPKAAWVFRKNDWIPSVPLVDIDGDGAVDLVLGYGRFDSREGIRKMILALQLDHSLRVHFFRPGRGFEPEPDFRRDVSLRMDGIEIHFAASRRDYLARAVDIAGDFDGDGHKDLLVHDRADGISMYPFRSRTEGFAKESALTFPHAGGLDHMVVEDLNGDGKSDLIIVLPGRSGVEAFTIGGR